MSDDPRWSEVDEFLTKVVATPDEALTRTVQASQEAELPNIQVSYPQGQMLHILALLTSPRRILEIGALGGLSAIYLARALPADGKLVTLELNADFARVARKNIDQAGVGDRVEIRVGPAQKTLETMTPERDGPFDFVFIDADKDSGATYVEHAIRLSRPGTLILLDNTVRDGEIVNPNTTDPRVQGTVRALKLMGSHPRLVSTCIQTVGCKGYDGFALARVR